MGQWGGLLESSPFMEKRKNVFEINVHPNQQKLYGGRTAPNLQPILSFREINCRNQNQIHLLWGLSIHVGHLFHMFPLKMYCRYFTFFF